jgi:large subunit ribosomal protein L22
MTTQTKIKWDSVGLLKYSPQKARLIANNMRGLQLDVAMLQLEFTNKGAAKDFWKVIKSAASNLGIQAADYAMYKVATIVVEEAQRLYRVMPRARGSANRLRRRYSRVRVALEAK